MQTPTDPDMPRKALTLIAQLPEFPQLELAQRRPAEEERRHALITFVPRISKLESAERREASRKVHDHRGRHLSTAHAPAPYGTSAGAVPRSPNQFRILADELRVTCICTSLPPPSAQWPVRSRRKERLGKRHGSRSEGSAPEPAPSGRRGRHRARVSLEPGGRTSQLVCSSGAPASIIQ